MLGRHGVILQVRGREVPILFTNEAIADAEIRLEKSIMVVVQGFLNGKSGVVELGTLLRAGMEAGKKAQGISGRTPTMSDAFKVMDEIGMTKIAEEIMPKVTEVLSFGINDDEEEDNDEDPK